MWGWGSFTRVIERRRVIVNLVNGTALDGVLFYQDGPLLVLKNAAYLEQGKEPVQLDGDTVVERNKVLWIQAP